MTWRPRFHLSTALAMMLTAGVLLGLNLRPSIRPSRRDDKTKDMIYYSNRLMTVPENSPEPAQDAFKFEYVSWGWPWRVYGGERFRVVPPHRRYKDCAYFTWRRSNAAANAAVAVTLILATGILCELILSRRRSPA